MYATHIRQPAGKEDHPPPSCKYAICATYAVSVTFARFCSLSTRSVRGSVRQTVARLLARRRASGRLRRAAARAAALHRRPHHASLSRRLLLLLPFLVAVFRHCTLTSGIVAAAAATATGRGWVDQAHLEVLVDGLEIDHLCAVQRSSIIRGWEGGGRGWVWLGGWMVDSR